MKNKSHSRRDFSWFTTITTRWHDNDIYGHVNNVVYYSFFDSAVNRFLIEEGALDIHNGDVIAFVVNSQCQYFQAVAYPQNIEVGVSVKALGNSSVTYQLGIFIADGEQAIAVGEFVHVFVNRASSSPVPIPAILREKLQSLCRLTDSGQ